MDARSQIGNVIRDLPRTGISDKLDQALAGAVIFAVTAFAAHKIGFPYPATVGLATTCFFAASIEIGQKITHSGVASWSDFFYTVAPAALFSGLIFFLR